MTLMSSPRFDIWPIGLDGWNYFLAQKLERAHRGGMRHQSLARPQHQPGRIHHVDHLLQLGYDRVRSAGNDLLDLLRLLIANVAVGIPQRHGLTMHGGAADVARRPLPVQRYTSKRAS